MSELGLRQTSTITTQQLVNVATIQSLQVLSYGAGDLREYVIDQLQGNFLADLDRLTRTPTAFPGGDRAWYSNLDTQTEAMAGEGTLHQSLRFQLGCMVLPEGMHALCLDVVEALDDNGYLRVSMDGLAGALQVPSALVTAALQVIQRLEPRGVGARGVKECLLLQAEPMDRTVQAIIANHLKALAGKRFLEIRDALGIPESELRRALKAIRAMNPKPGAGFQSMRRLPYLTADLLVRPKEGGEGFEVLVNDTLSPGLVQGSGYLDLASLPPAGKAEYRRCKRQLDFIRHAVSQRAATLLALGSALLGFQPEVLTQGAGHPRPLTQDMLARATGFHQSTVSRAIRNKSIRDAGGRLLPMASLFSSGINSAAGAVSPAVARAQILDIITTEAAGKALSDRELALMLAQRGLPLSRRTVAKYRAGMRLSNSWGRKREA